MRVALADIPASVLERITLSPLSPAAVLEMALEAGGDSEGLWELTGGNPFFLTELLAADHESVPKLGLGRGHGEDRPSLPGFTLAGRSGVRCAGSGRDGADRCGARAFDGGSDLRRRRPGSSRCRRMLWPSVTSLRGARSKQIFSPIKRREINLVVLRAVEDLEYDVSRAAHHAQVGGDIDALVRLAPIAARRAADMESHREAVAHLRALEPYLDRLDAEMRADHYDLWAYEELLGDEIRTGREDHRNRDRDRRILGDPVKLGNSLLIGSRIASFRDRRAAALEMANEAASVLESVGGEELAIAYSSHLPAGDAGP